MRKGTRLIAGFFFLPHTGGFLFLALCELCVENHCPYKIEEMSETP